MQQTQEQKYQNDLFAELDKNIMTWDDNLHEWHPVALQSLNYLPLQSLNISQAWYWNLFMKEEAGIRMSVAQILCNSVIKVSPAEMGYTAEEWNSRLKLNTIITKRWNALAMPINEAVSNRYAILDKGVFQMNGAKYNK